MAKKKIGPKRVEYIKDLTIQGIRSSGLWGLAGYPPLVARPGLAPGTSWL